MYQRLLTRYYSVLDAIENLEVTGCQVPAELLAECDDLYRQLNRSA